jgi:Family of unknown function (DUF6226)
MSACRTGGSYDAFRGEAIVCGYGHSVDLTTVIAAVEAAFAVSGAGTPPWPAPHPDREPLEEEYSRCLDPYKYLITHARADAWLRALTELELATPRELLPTGLWRDQRDHGRVAPDLAVLLEPARDGALGLLLVYRDVREGLCASVEVGAGYPAVSTGGSPSCGCDACDGGSVEVLEELDKAVERVVAGDWIHVRAPGVDVSGTPTGYSAGGDDLRGVDIPALLADARAGRSPHDVTRAIRWW